MTTEETTAMRQISGAVLRSVGDDRPYSNSAPIQIEDVDLEGPRAGELLVRIEAAGVCHSDLSVVNGHRPRPIPMLLGHEAAGIVTELGDGVDDLVVGQRVVMTFLPRCENCDACREGGRLPCVPGSTANGLGELIGGGSRLSRGDESIRHHLGVSGFATYAVVDRRSVVPVGSDIPPAVAALLGCAVLTGGGAILNAGRIQAGQDLIVVGLGGIGMAALLVARAIGCRTITGVDPSPEKISLARSLGADDAMTPADALKSGVRAPVVLDATGVGRGFETAFELTQVGGTTVTAGLPQASDVASISPLRLTAEARTVIGSYLGSSIPSRDIPRYEDMWRAGDLPLEKLITRTLELDQVNLAMDLLSDATELRQVIVLPQD